MKDQITINGPDGAFGAYIARPAGLPAPVVVVLQELFGVNVDIRKHYDRDAGARDVQRLLEVRLGTTRPPKVSNSRGAQYYCTAKKRQVRQEEAG